MAGEEPYRVEPRWRNPVIGKHGRFGRCRTRRSDAHHQPVVHVTRRRPPPVAFATGTDFRSFLAVAADFIALLETTLLEFAPAPSDTHGSV